MYKIHKATNCHATQEADQGLLQPGLEEGLHGKAVGDKT